MAFDNMQINAHAGETVRGRIQQRNATSKSPDVIVQKR